MTIRKEHREFHQVDLATGWRAPPGYPPGIEQKILAGALDEIARTGSRTRLLRFEPGARTMEPFVHDYWEEVYLLSGDLIVGDERKGSALADLRPAHLCLPSSGSPCMVHSGRRPGACCSRRTTTMTQLYDEGFPFRTP